MTAGITGQFAGSQQVGAARFCGLARLMCSPALRQGPSLNPHRHLGISLREVPFSLVLCLTNSSPFSSLEVHSLSPQRKRLQLHLDSPHPELQQESVLWQKAGEAVGFTSCFSCLSRMIVTDCLLFSAWKEEPYIFYF